MTSADACCWRRVGRQRSSPPTCLCIVASWGFLFSFFFLVWRGVTGLGLWHRIIVVVLSRHLGNVFAKKTMAIGMEWVPVGSCPGKGGWTELARYYLKSNSLVHRERFPMRKKSHIALSLVLPWGISRKYRRAWSQDADQSRLQRTPEPPEQQAVSPKLASAGRAAKASPPNTIDPTRDIASYMPPLRRRDLIPYPSCTPVPKPASPLRPTFSWVRYWGNRRGPCAWRPRRHYRRSR